MPPELEAAPSLPESTAYIWLWFIDLASARQCGMSVNPISYTEILSWSQLKRITPAEWEIEAIKAIDAAFLASIAEEVK